MARSGARRKLDAELGGRCPGFVRDQRAPNRSGLLRDRSELGRGILGSASSGGQRPSAMHPAAQLDERVAGVLGSLDQHVEARAAARAHRLAPAKATPSIWSR